MKWNLGGYHIVYLFIYFYLIIIYLLISHKEWIVLVSKLVEKYKYSPNLSRLCFIQAVWKLLVYHHAKFCFLRRRIIQHVIIEFRQTGSINLINFGDRPVER